MGDTKTDPMVTSTPEQKQAPADQTATAAAVDIAFEIVEKQTAKMQQLLHAVQECKAALGTQVPRQ